MRYLFVGLAVFSLWNRGTAQISFDYDKKADFANYTTYAWIAPGDSVLNRERKDKLFGGTIMYLADQEIQKRGMAIDTVGPSAVFMFSSSSADRIEYSQTPTLSVGVGVAGPGYYAGGMAPVAGGNIIESPYFDGSLTFYMYDAKTGTLLWQGGIKKSFKNDTDITKLITDSINKIFKKLPKKVVKGGKK